MTDDRSEIYRKRSDGRPDATAQNGEIRGRDGRIRGQVHDGMITRGPFDSSQGQVTGKRVSSGMLFSNDWGYVDDDGNVRQSGGIFGDKIIGKVRGTNYAAALAHFVLRFKTLEERINKLVHDFNNSNNKAGFYQTIQNSLNMVENYEALGDFGWLMSQLRGLERECFNAQTHNRHIKQALAEEAERLSFSTNWREAKDRLQQLMDQWKTTGNAGDADEGLWMRFNQARQKFFDRRREHTEEIKRQQAANTRAKEELCREAESLSYSTDWRETGNRHKQAMDQWRQIGRTESKETDDAFWARFQRARQIFFDRRSEFFAEKDRERERNAQAKEELCREAERWSYSTDWKEAGERLKEMMTEWKQIGGAGKDRDDELWARFQQARQIFYDRRERNWEDNAHAKEDLIREAEYYDCGGDWGSGNQFMADLLDRWKQAGSAGPDDNRLWQDFQAARSRFYDARSDYFASRGR